MLYASSEVSLGYGMFEPKSSPRCAPSTLFLCPRQFKCDANGFLACDAAKALQSAWKKCVQSLRRRLDVFGSGP